MQHPRNMPTAGRRPRALADIQALCSMQLHPHVLIPAVLEALHALVPSYRNLFDWTDEQGQLLHYFVEGPIDAPIAQLYFDEFHNRREAEAMPRFDTLVRHPHGVRSARELDHAQFFRSALYNEIWRPQGFHTRLEGVVRGPCGRLMGSLVLYRAAGEPHYTMQDEKHLAAVLPALAEGLLAATASAAGPERHVPAAEAAETVLMTLQGHVCHASAGAHRLLLMADGGAARHSLSKPLQGLAGRLLSLLLERLRDRSCHHWQAQAQGAEGGVAAAALAPPVSVTHETPAGQWRASGTLLQPLYGSHAPPATQGPLLAAPRSPEPLVQVTLQRLEPHRLAVERALRTLPLTTGQAAVCRHLLQGQTQNQISQALGVAPATVVDHVRKLYRTLDLRSTAELRSLVEARVAGPTGAAQRLRARG